MTLKIQLLVFLLAVCVLTKEAPAAEEELAAGETPDYSEVPNLELMTVESVSPPSDLGEKTTDAELLTTSEDHLEMVTLVYIILGTIAAIGVATVIVIALAKKMQGRYSP